MDLLYGVLVHRNLENSNSFHIHLRLSLLVLTRERRQEHPMNFVLNINCEVNSFVCFSFFGSD